MFSEFRNGLTNEGGDSVSLQFPSERASRKILLLNTGGTIGMVRTEKGYAPCPGEVAKVLDRLTKNQGESLPSIDLLEFNPLLDSTDVSCRDWVKMAKIISKYENDYNGFVILHGTDTMAYTASALSFMLDGLNKPVILTGSQIPLFRLRSDALENLVTAILLAAYSDIPEVGLYFSGKLLRGNRATKVSADLLSAFDSPNYPPLAEAGVDIRIFPSRIRQPGSGIKLKLFEEQRIGVLKIFPGIQFSLFESLPLRGSNGLILEAFGAGNIPAAQGSLRNFLQSCAEQKIVTVVVTQCLQGRARLGEYEASSSLCSLGAVGGLDMTVEAAVAKLTFLLSQNLSYIEICQQMRVDLQGELSQDYEATEDL